MVCNAMYTQTHCAQQNCTHWLILAIARVAWSPAVVDMQFCDGSMCGFSERSAPAQSAE